ncbi:sigma-70 family RNA polymerase sigma factor [Deminuibacter soli]|uniref:RNA polymerase subunit sigma-70 n=1 Tax=Deminuibacter soli TaxID=2291815 RepID=A0A3E1NRF6_9BACT|nr:sigma-70 family RNA polymerase sigma factor [Deminuibacter soli]RFM30368.1 RNA polymerase subunit sigma-70 [Deminuibacter soli]
MAGSKIDEWVMQYSDMLLRYALPRVHDREIAKDLVQETFVAAWRNIDHFRGEISEKNWLYTILKNKIIDHFRKAANRLTDSLPEIGEETAFRNNGHWKSENYPAAWGIDYNQGIESKEFYEVLDQCKSKLKDLQNMVFTMKYLEGAASEEICKVLHITPSNYWVLLHRAKVQLRSCLEKNWFLR